MTLETAAPKVSVLIAARGRADYLADAIASVEAQTDPDWECLVCANGPEDKAVREVLIASAARLGPRFDYEIVGELSDRPAQYWNRLMTKARGRFLTILDDDNRKRPDFIEKMTAPLEENEEVAATTCGWRVINPWGDAVPQPERHDNLRTEYDTLFDDNTVDTNALLFRASVLHVIGFFDESLTTCEDWHFVIRLAMSFPIVNLPDTLLDYRMHPGMRSHNAVRLGRHANIARVRAELYPGR